MSIIKRILIASPPQVDKTNGDANDKHRYGAKKGEDNSNTSSKKSNQSTKDSESPKKQQQLQNTNDMQKMNKKNKKNNNTMEDNAQYVYDLQRPTGAFHIEYKLVEKAPSYTIEVVFWNFITKVVSQDNQTVIYRNYVTDKYVWIPVMVQHKFEHLSNEELQELKESTITVTISNIKKKTKVKVEKRNVFFIKQEDVGARGFLEAFDYNPNTDFGSRKSDKNRSNNRSNMSTDFYQTKLHKFDNEILYPRMLKIIKKIEAKEDVVCKEFAQAPIMLTEEESTTFDFNPNVIQWAYIKHQRTKTKMVKEAGKKKDKKEKHKEAKYTDCRIRVSGEALFTDPLYALYTWDSHNAMISKAFAIISANDILTRRQKYDLNPFVVKLETLNNIPVRALKEQKYHAIYLQYTIPKYLKCMTQARPVERRKVHFNEAHAYFNVPVDKVVEFFQTSKLRVELVGIRMPESFVAPRLFGSDSADYRKQILNPPARGTREYPAEILLAVATYDLSTLLKATPFVRCKTQMRTPQHLYSQPTTSVYNTYRIYHTVTINDIHQKGAKDPHSPANRTPFTDGMLLHHGTSLKVQIYFTIPLDHVTLHDFLIRNTNLYKRMLLIVFDEQIMKVLLNEIMLHNQDFFREVMIPNYYTMNRHSEKIDPGDKMVTGFFIDNGNSFIFCLEARTDTHCFEMIWTQIKSFNESACKIFYNSQHRFEHRIYEYFLPLGGFYKITLKFPLQDIFRIQDVYLEGFAPKPCAQALRKLELLLRTPTIREVHQYSLFPTANELLSFNMEFGISHKVSDKEKIAK